jgi:endonuclease YncB( thermonuclease family)
MAFRFALVLILILPTPSLSWAWPGKVIHTTDGDTLTVLRDGQKVKVCLYGVDCPEKRHAFGSKVDMKFQSLQVMYFMTFCRASCSIIDRFVD